MTTHTTNPYPQIGKQLIAGMDAIAGSLKPGSTTDDLANAIYKFIAPIYYPGGLSNALEMEIKSFVYNVINTYKNDAIGNTLMYSPQQMAFVDVMLGSEVTDETPINALNELLLDIEDNISCANLPPQSQIPLLLGIQAGKSIYGYWTDTIVKPGNWAPFFQKPEALNYANIPFWTAACIEGALIGAHETVKVLIAPTTDIVSVDIISSLIGTLTTGAGKVIFKWIPGTFTGGFSMVLQDDSQPQLFGRRRNSCNIINNCQGGNCAKGCGGSV